MNKKITALQGKHFLAWLRKQVRTTGRNTVVGYIGDHVDYPLEMWMQEVLGKRVSIASCDGMEYQGQTYYLSPAFEGMSICVQENSLDELPECGWREISAQEMLQEARQYIGPDDYLFAQSEEVALAA